jgi:hypothetical protein
LSLESVVERDGYIALVRGFVEGRVAIAEFERRYLAEFKAEPAGMDPSLFAILDRLFSDVDSYTPGLGSDEEDDFSITETSLRRCAWEALAKLEREDP